MATVIRIKSDSLRREITISSVGTHDGVWEMRASGMLPIQFNDDELSNVIAELCKKQFNMRKDPNQVKRGNRPNPVWLHSKQVADTPTTPPVESQTKPPEPSVVDIPIGPKPQVKRAKGDGNANTNANSVASAV